MSVASIPPLGIILYVEANEHLASEFKIKEAWIVHK